MIDIRILELIIIVYSVISCLFSLSIILTYLIFKDMQSKVFMKFIFYISVSDFLMNIVSAFGFPPSGSTLCWIQGSAQIYFALSSWMWTTVLSYTTYCLVVKGYIGFNLRNTFIFCWGFPLLLALVPLTTNKYGSADPPTQWCLIVADEKSPYWGIEVWPYGSFFGWLFLCTALMIYWGISIRIRYMKSTLNDIVNRTYQKVRLYPIAMVVCWLLNYFATVFLTGTSDLDILMSCVSMICGISYGILTACIFIAKSELFYYRWRNLYFYFFDKKNFVEELVLHDVPSESEVTKRSTGSLTRNWKHLNDEVEGTMIIDYDHNSIIHRFTSFELPNQFKISSGSKQTMESNPLKSTPVDNVTNTDSTSSDPVSNPMV